MPLTVSECMSAMRMQRDSWVRIYEQLMMSLSLEAPGAQAPGPHGCMQRSPSCSTCRLGLSLQRDFAFTNRLCKLSVRTLLYLESAK